MAKYSSKVSKTHAVDMIFGRTSGRFESEHMVASGVLTCRTMIYRNYFPVQSAMNESAQLCSLSILHMFIIVTCGMHGPRRVFRRVLVPIRLKVQKRTYSSVQEARPYNNTRTDSAAGRMASDAIFPRNIANEASCEMPFLTLNVSES